MKLPSWVYGLLDKRGNYFFQLIDHEDGWSVEQAFSRVFDDSAYSGIIPLKMREDIRKIDKAVNQCPGRMPLLLDLAYVCQRWPDGREVTNRERGNALGWGQRRFEKRLYVAQKAFKNNYERLDKRR